MSRPALTYTSTVWNRFLGSRAYRVIYRVWLALLIARVALLVALICTIMVAYLVAETAHAQTRGVRAERQESIRWLLIRATLQQATDTRESCALGNRPASMAQVRAAGFIERPDVADECVTALTRIGREGKLGYVRDTSSDRLTPALAFDRGFVTAWRNREAPAGLPAMAALKPAAERCLAQAEKDTDLCHSVGYAYGLRAVNGETVIVR